MRFWVLSLEMICVAALSLAGAAPTTALQAAPKQVEFNQASLDTTPITFSIGDARYKVPRNYIVWMDNWNGGPQTLVRFKVTYPKFEPLDQKNTPCMSLAPLYRPPGCLPVEFIVANGGRSVEGGGWAASDEEAFNNIRDLFHSQTPLPGRYGFEVYKTAGECAHRDVPKAHA